MPKDADSHANRVPLRIFYDGACPLCSREIGHYQRLAGGESLGYVDIAAPDFDARSYGLSPAACQRELHVLTEDGKVLRGVDAFAAIWARLPRYRRLVPLTQLPVSRQLMQVGYAAFARARPYLPGRKPCGTAACTPAAHKAASP